MISVTPQGSIYLCKAPLINDYKNQLTFSNLTSQINYFNTRILKTFDNYTYIKKDNINNYIYELYSPLNPYEFLNNPILSVSLYNNVGKVEYEKLKEYFKIPRFNLRDYEDISCNFSDVFEVSNISSFENMTNDLKRVNINKLSLVSKIDLENVISLIPDEMLNIRSITRDTKDLIYKLLLIGT